MEPASELPIERSPSPPPHAAPESDPSVDELAAEGGSDAGGDGMLLSDDDGVREAGVAHASDGEDVVPVADAPDGEDVVSVADASDGEDVVPVADASDAEDVVPVADAPDGEDVVPVADAASPVDNEDAETPLPVVKRKRGRPRKVPVIEKVETEEDDAVEDDDSPPPPVVADSSGKRRRGRPRKNPVAAKAPMVKKGKGEEAVCFVCFDGGDLVICDKRGCTKVYHADCVQKDESYFRTRGRWNCGWHICSHCEKAAHYMCYTCTYSLCKACNKGSGFVCVRGNKGFCGTCYQTVMSIEANEHTDGEKAEADLSGQTSWDYLFKIYWSGLKGKLSLTFDELSAANNRRKRPGGVTYNEDSSDESYHVNDDQESGSDVSDDNEGKGSSRKKVRRRSRNTVSEERSVKQVDLGTNAEDDTKWASSELLEFVSHMKNGDTSSLSHFEVQDLILEYIKKNNLRDQRKKSQIICDSMLRKLFHKERVAHFEMLKLLESHFLMKEASQVIIDNNQGANLALDSGQMDAEGYHDAMTKFTFDKRRKSRKRLEEKEPQTNIDDYAAIDVHNIKLMYLRRSLMEDLLDELDTFNEKVTGTFVRIRISGENKKQEIYRLVQVVGTHETGEEYKLGKKTTHIRLNIQNLDKAEVVPMDILSNQEFTEDECRRLRQSIKCRVINPLTVGQVQDKAMVLQALRVDEWLESEKLRLGHLRDRASEKGRRKELRECVEKLQLLNKPEERSRMLNDIPEIHDDPKMDPDYESADEEPEDTQENSRKSSQPFYPRKGRNFASGKVDSAHFNGARRASNNIWEVKKSVPVEDARFEVNSFSNVGDKESMLSPAQGKGWSNNQHGGIPDQLNDISLETIYSPVSNAPSGPPITSETEVMWQYKDPALKVQGPFSLSQLRKWNIGGYFPPDMTIWRMCDKRNDQYLLTDALNGKFQKTLLPVEPQSSGLPQPIATATPTPTPWLDNNQNHGNRNVVPNNTAFPASNIQVGSVPMVWSAPQIVIPRPIQGRIGPSGWETSSNVNILPGQVQTHMNYVPPVQPPINYGPTVPPVQANINFVPAVPQLQTNVNFMPPIQPHFVPPVPFSGNNYRPPPFPGRGGRGGNAGRWNRVQDVATPWNSNMSGGQRPNAQGYDRRPPWNPSVQQSSGEVRFPRPAIDSNNQWGNNMFNPPTPTPQLTGSGFPGGQGTPNMLHKTTPEIMKSNEKAAGNSAWGSWSASAPDNTKKGDGWNSWSAISSALPDKTNTTEKADGPDSWSPVSSTLPYKKTTSGSVTAASTSNENQFFQGECPSPTPLCERQELDDKDLQASFTEDTTDKDKSISEAKKDLAPILVADDKTNDDVWSLPSPTPSTNPAALNQGWASGDTKVQATVWDQAVQNLETTDGGKSSGWGEWEKSSAQGPSAQTSTNPNRGLGFAPGSTNISAGGAPPVSGSAAGGKGWGPPLPGPPLPGGTNQSFGSFVPAVGNTPNPGWGAPPQNPNWVAGPMRGGPPRPPPRGQGPTGVCKFHERGFCRKGSACQYRHV